MKRRRFLNTTALSGLGLVFSSFGFDAIFFIDNVSRTIPNQKSQERFR